MSEHRALKNFCLLAGLILVVAIGVHLLLPRRELGQPQAAKDQAASARLPKAGVRRPAPLRLAVTPSDVPPAAAASDMAKMLRGAEHSVKVAREDLEKYLAESRRTAASLLAAFQASEDAAYLKEAAAGFPGDPRVQLAVLMNNAFPEERRKWLERFKQSAPDNSLASYLSAHEHLQQGRFEEAINDLLDASQRPRFQHYALEGMQDMQDLLLAAGKSPAEAKVMSMLGAPLPHLAKMKQLAFKMADMQSQYNGMGDAQSFDAVTQIGLTLARRMNGSEGGKFIIDQLVGIAIESQFLKACDPASTPEPLGMPVKDRLEDLAQQKAEMKRLAPLVDALSSRGSEAELISYFDRVKLEGEVAALRWLEARRGGQ
jgi:hypothetical protein